MTNTPHLRTDFDTRDRSIRTFVLSQDRRVLLVKQKYELHGKAPIWGMPGGSTLEEDEKFGPVHGLNDDEFDTLLCKRRVETIVELLDRYSIDLRDFTRILEETEGDSFDTLDFLTAIKEGLEETGLLLAPRKRLFDDRMGLEGVHKVVVFNCEVVAGELMATTEETDDSGWFDLSKLPKAIYQTHFQRISRAVCQTLGPDVIVAREESCV